MFNIQPMPSQIDDYLVQLLEQVETATVGHVLHSGFVDREIRAVLDGKRVAGTAVFLCSDSAASITGTNISVEGGWTAH